MTADELVSSSDWALRARAMADHLTRRGVLRTPGWRTAIEETPRHHFVSSEDLGLASAEPQVWLDSVYSDTTLVVQRRPLPAKVWGSEENDSLPTSSSTMPSLMVEMLELLQVEPGHRVLEIGTGTGYNTALLSHRLGPENVVSIDIDPDLVHIAKSRMATLGYAPTLQAGDGLAGVPEHRPYDRIIATCAVPDVPLAWIEQLAPGGSMLINLRGEFAGVLCFLTKQEDDEVVGPVVRSGGNFMWMRKELLSPLRGHESPTVVRAQNVSRRTTELSPQDIVKQADFHWFAQLEIPGLRAISETEIFDPLARKSRPGILIYAGDGSHAQVVSQPELDGRYRVIQGGGGNRRLWDTIETAHAEWNRLGRPSPLRFGVVANPTVEFAWLDDDMAWPRWPLPLAS